MKRSPQVNRNRLAWCWNDRASLARARPFFVGGVMPKSAPMFRPHGKSRKAQVAERKKRYDDRRESSARRGYGGKWRRARHRFLMDNPLCVCCEKDGQVSEARVVDHIMPHGGDLKLFWKRWNWQALCKRCHDGRKQSVEALWKIGHADIGSLFLGADEVRRDEFISGYQRLRAG